MDRLVQSEKEEWGRKDRDGASLNARRGVKGASIPVI